MPSAPHQLQGPGGSQFPPALLQQAFPVMSSLCQPAPQCQLCPLRLLSDGRIWKALHSLQLPCLMPLQLLTGTGTGLPVQTTLPVAARLSLSDSGSFTDSQVPKAETELLHGVFKAFLIGVANLL